MSLSPENRALINRELDPLNLCIVDALYSLSMLNHLLDAARTEGSRLSATCSTCRHFTPETNGFGSCARWRTGYSMRIEDLASDEVLVENDEGWGMLAGPDFGCVLHNPPPSDGEVK